MASTTVLDGNPLAPGQERVKEEPVSNFEMKPSSSGFLEIPKEKPILNREISYVCEICNKSFLRKFMYIRHAKFHLEKVLGCEKCEKTFLQKSDLQRHIKTHSKTCDVCSMVFSRKADLLKHKKIHMPTQRRKSTRQRKIQKQSKVDKRSVLIHRLCKLLQRVCASYD